MAKESTSQTYDVYYGTFKAVGTSTCPSSLARTALIGPSGCGKSTRPSLVESECTRFSMVPRVEGKVSARRRGHLRPRHRSGQRPASNRDGLSAAESLSTMSITETSSLGSKLEKGRKIKKAETDESSRSRCAARTSGPEVKDRLDRPGAGLSVGNSSGCVSLAQLLSNRRLCSWMSLVRRWTPFRLFAIEELITQLRQQFTIVIVTHNMQQAARISARPRLSSTWLVRANRDASWRLAQLNVCSRAPLKSRPRTTSQAASGWIGACAARWR